MKKKIPTYKPSELIRMALDTGLYFNGNNHMNGVFEEFMDDKKVLRKDVRSLRKADKWFSLMMDGHMLNHEAYREGLLPNGMQSTPEEFNQAYASLWQLKIQQLRSRGL